MPALHREGLLQNASERVCYICYLCVCAVCVSFGWLHRLCVLVLVLRLVQAQWLTHVLFHGPQHGLL